MRPLPLLSWLLTLLLVQLALADPPVFSRKASKPYDKGKFGVVPETQLKTTIVRAKHLLRRHWDERCNNDTEYYFLAPRGKFSGWPGPTILDNDGHLVWMARGFHPAYNFHVQTYKGEDYLTWWTGDDRVVGHGAGRYYMVCNTPAAVESTNNTSLISITASLSWCRP